VRTGRRSFLIEYRVRGGACAVMPETPGAAIRMLDRLAAVGASILSVCVTEPESGKRSREIERKEICSSLLRGGTR